MKRLTVEGAGVKDEWFTPAEVVEALREHYQLGRFNLDPCADDSSSCGEAYYSIEDDGLTKDWYGDVWVNPPYSRIMPWIEKGISELQRDNGPDRVVYLVPAATETKWFQRVFPNLSAITFLTPRVQFIPSNELVAWRVSQGKSPKLSNTLPSLGLLLNRESVWLEQAEPMAFTLNWKTGDYR